MHFTIPDVLTSEEIARARQLMETARFVDGRTTASGAASRRSEAKRHVTTEAICKMGRAICDKAGFLPFVRLG